MDKHLIVQVWLKWESSRIWRGIRSFGLVWHIH